MKKKLNCSVKVNGVTYHVSYNPMLRTSMAVHKDKVILINGTVCGYATSKTDAIRQIRAWPK